MSRALGMILAIAAGGAALAIGRSQTPAPEKSSYDYAAAAAPLRASAIEKLKQAVNIDPASTDVLATEATAALATIQTSWNETELRTIRNRVSQLSVDRNTAGYANVGSAYADAAKAIEDVAKVVEARNIAIAKPLVTSSAGHRGAHGRPHTPAAARRSTQLSATRSR